jgi:hypothetical protein
MKSQPILRKSIYTLILLLFSLTTVFGSTEQQPDSIQNTSPDSIQVQIADTTSPFISIPENKPQTSDSSKPVVPIVKPVNNAVSYPQATQSLDKIIKLNGEELNVIIKEKKESEVRYYNPGSPVIKRVLASQVKELRFADGRVIEINPKANFNTKKWEVSRAAKNWNEIPVTFDPAEITGLTEMGPIEVEWTSEKLTADNDYLEKYATSYLKKKAYKMKASAILITEKTFNRQYGEVPSIKMKCIAYGIPQEK